MSIEPMIDAAAFAYGNYLDAKKRHAESQQAAADALGVSVGDLNIADAIAEKMLARDTYLIAFDNHSDVQLSMLEDSYFDFGRRVRAEPREGHVASRTLAEITSMFQAQQRFTAVSAGPSVGVSGLKFLGAVLLRRDDVPVNMVRWCA